MQVENTAKAKKKINLNLLINLTPLLYKLNQEQCLCYLHHPLCICSTVNTLDCIHLILKVS